MRYLVQSLRHTSRCATSCQPLRLVGTDAASAGSGNNPESAASVPDQSRLVATARRLGGEQCGCKIGMIAFNAPRISLVVDIYLQQPQRQSRERNPHSIAAALGSTPPEPGRRAHSSQPRHHTVVHSRAGPPSGSAPSLRGNSSTALSFSATNPMNADTAIGRCRRLGYSTLRPWLVR